MACKCSPGLEDNGLTRLSLLMTVPIRTEWEQKGDSGQENELVQGETDKGLKTPERHQEGESRRRGCGLRQSLGFPPQKGGVTCRHRRDEASV